MTHLHPINRLALINLARDRAREALAYLRTGEAPQAADYLARALKSIEGARRHASGAARRRTRNPSTTLDIVNTHDRLAEFGQLVIDMLTEGSRSDNGINGADFIDAVSQYAYNFKLWQGDEDERGTA